MKNRGFMVAGCAESEGLRVTLNAAQPRGRELAVLVNLCKRWQSNHVKIHMVDQEFIFIACLATPFEVSSIFSGEIPQ